MTCGVSSRRVVREALLNRQHGPQPDKEPREFDSAFEIAGTWDFKWPRGTRIHVAFQLLPDGMKIPHEEFVKTKGLVQDYARRWKLPPAVELCFDGADLDPPLDDSKLPMNRHRSSFLRDDPRKNPYDILISLQDLPVEKFDPFRGPGLEKERIDLPVSTLGSYARRADYGAPTMYLGRFGRFVGEPFLRYFEETLAQHVIVHEFGHALGLPHLHQHPELIAPNGTLPRDVRARIKALDGARADYYKPTELVRHMLQTLLGMEIEPDVVEDHLLRVWRGNMKFSDWVSFAEDALADHTSSATLDSVMTFPYYRFTKRGADEPPTCNHSSEVCGLAGKFAVEPGVQDQAMLERMYGH